MKERSCQPTSVWRLPVGGLLTLVALALVLAGGAPALAGDPALLIHNSTNTGSTQWGGWGITGQKYGQFDCSTCHTKNTTNIKRIKTTLAAPDADPFPNEAGINSVTFTRTVGAGDSFGDDSDLHTTSSAICEACHSQTKYHRYDTTGQAGGDKAHFNDQDCMACHKHNTGFTASCTGCHGNAPTASTLGGADGLADTPSTTGSATHGSHPVHVDTLGLADCNFCHDGWQAAGEMPKTIGGPGTQDINIGFANWDTATGTYSGQDGVYYNGVQASSPPTPQQCSNVYCHGGTGNMGGTDPIWGASVSCGDCHKTTNVDPPAIASHGRHAGQGAGELNLTCDNCHGGIPVAQDGHVDGQVAWDVTALAGGTPTYKVAGSGLTANRAEFDAYGSCDSIYCHSSVQATDGLAGAPIYATPTWGAASVACNDCHGQDGTVAGLPATGSHPNHPFSCDNCHNGLGEDVASHADGTINLSINPGVDLGGAAYSLGANTAPGDGFGTCSNISCHGGTQTPQWGTAGDCTTCHNNGSGQPWPSVGAHEVHFNEMGQDLSGADGPTTIAQCNLCHTGFGSGQAGHADGNNYQVAFAATLADKSGGAPAYSSVVDDAGTCSNVACHGGQTTPAWNTTDTIDLSLAGAAQRAECLKCHAVGSAEYNGIQSGPHGAHVTTANFACDVCHSAQPAGHFDSANLLTTAMENPNGLVADAQGAYGPVGDAYTDSTGAGFAVGGSSGSCANFACHGDANWDDTISADCAFCHGGATTGSVQTSQGNYWPDGLDSAPLPSKLGRHDAHIVALAEKIYGHVDVDALLNDVSSDAQQKALCAYCHDNPGAGGHYSYSTTTTNFHPAWNVGAAEAGDYNITEANSCSNIDCHKGKATGSSTEGTNITTFGWLNDAGTATCQMCHIDITADVPHTTHTGSTVSTIDCTECHAAGTAWATTSPSYADGHIDGGLDVTGTVSLTYSAGSCSANQCHNDGSNGNPADNLYVWGNTNNADGGCADCHGATVTSNAHQAHLDAHLNGGASTSGIFVSGSLTCGSCHTAETAATHMDGTITFVGSENYTGDVDVTVAASYGSCDNSACHKSNAVTFQTSPDWGRATTTADDCAICHLAAMTQGSHGAHVESALASNLYTNTTDGTTTTEYKFACSNCHGSTLANHLSGAVNVDAGVSFTAGPDTCANASCHNDGTLPLTPVVTPAWGTTPADSCAVCHGNSPTSLQNGSGVSIHSVHTIGIHTKTTYDPTVPGLMADSGTEISSHGGRYDAVEVTSTVLNCQVCHFDTVTSWNNNKNTACAACHDGGPAVEGGLAAIADKSKHIDGVVDVAFMTGTLRTKAQIRDITTIPEIDAQWVRQNAGFLETLFKGTNMYDETRAGLDAGTFTPGADTCTNVACHNGNAATWAAPSEDANANCANCHTQL